MKNNYDRGDDISTISTDFSQKYSPNEEYKYSDKENSTYNLKSLKEKIFTSKGKENINYDNKLNEYSTTKEVEKLYDLVLSGSFDEIRKLESIQKVDIKDKEDAKLLNHIGFMIRKNELFSKEDYSNTNIDSTELAVTIADQLQCMGEEIEFYS
jgi:hypothetical protein